MPAPPPIPETMRAWQLHEYGEPLDVLRIDEVSVPVPGAGELLVEVQAIPLNLNDMERVTGRNMMVRPDLPTIPGMEVMGVVVACGDGTEPRLGERVVAVPRQAYGGYAEYAVCPSHSAFPMPAEIGLPDAAALYFPFHLAWLGLFDRAKLTAGESVLIHAAAGGSGSAAIQAAKHVGARVFATASSAAKLELCTDLGADVVINYLEEDFADVVLDATDGRGVDVVFDNVGETVLAGSTKCIAYNGRYLLMGFASDKSHVDQKYVVPRSLAVGNFSMAGAMLAYIPDAGAADLKRLIGFNFVPESVGQRFMKEINDLVLQGKLRPVIDKVVDFDDLPAALHALSSRETTGRTVVRLW
ncbi:zinc-binding alcohol dehydrogenase family protein [Nocardioides sp.]|uniref:quinone oxidoreductase family protein n=1 Tax=Nocardioides sp. TaxID=35761 RepID=UPI0035694D95